jgi:hypothetical protein
VDVDFLDTEKFCNPERVGLRSCRVETERDRTLKKRAKNETVWFLLEKGLTCGNETHRIADNLINKNH